MITMATNSMSSVRYAAVEESFITETQGVLCEIRTDAEETAEHPSYDATYHHHTIALRSTKLTLALL
jgi:hypothetical protein